MWLARWNWMRSSVGNPRGSAAAGFTLLEMLVALLVMGVVIVSAIGTFSAQSQTFMRQDLAVATEENLRVGMDALADSLRNGAYGVPTANLPTWIPCVAGFTSNPKISTASPATV